MIPKRLIPMLFDDILGLAGAGLVDVSFVILIVAAEGHGGKQIHLKNVTSSSNVATFRAIDGVIVVPQTIERLSEITISSGDGGVLVMADGISNWEIVSRIGT